MEKRVVLATHGTLGEGMRASMRLILGDDSPIECLSAYIDLRKDYQEEFEQLVSTHDYEAQRLIVLTDVLGGSVNNEFMRLLGDYPFLLVTGLNLALLLEVVTCPGDELEERLPEIVQNAREHIVVCNGLAFAPRDETDEEQNEF